MLLLIKIKEWIAVAHGNKQQDMVSLDKWWIQVPVLKVWLNFSFVPTQHFSTSAVSNRTGAQHQVALI